VVEVKLTLTHQENEAPPLSVTSMIAAIWPVSGLGQVLDQRPAEQALGFGARDLDRGDRVVLSRRR
jgi:hypothetical protein